MKISLSYRLSVSNHYYISQTLSSRLRCPKFYREWLGINQSPSGKLPEILELILRGF